MWAFVVAAPGAAAAPGVVAIGGPALVFLFGGGLYLAARRFPRSPLFARPVLLLLVRRRRLSDDRRRPTRPLPAGGLAWSVGHAVCQYQWFIGYALLDRLTGPPSPSGSRSAPSPPSGGARRCPFPKGAPTGGGSRPARRRRWPSAAQGAQVDPLVRLLDGGIHSRFHARRPPGARRAADERRVPGAGARRAAGDGGELGRHPLQLRRAALRDHHLRPRDHRLLPHGRLRGAAQHPPAARGAQRRRLLEPLQLLLQRAGRSSSSTTRPFSATSNAGRGCGGSSRSSPPPASETSTITSCARPSGSRRWASSRRFARWTFTPFSAFC